MTERNFRIGVVQMSCTPAPEQNLERAIAHLRAAAAKGAEIVCLPELFQTQYFCQREDIALFDLAEPIPGPATERLGIIARDLKITIIASLFERRAPGIYHNTAAIIDREGALQGIYRKMHIPDDPLYYEKFYFTPGDLGFKTFDNPLGRSGRWCAGTSGIRREHDLGAFRREHPVLSDGNRLAPGREGANSGPRSSMRGEPSSVRMRSRTGSMLRRRTEWAMGRFVRVRGELRPRILGFVLRRGSVWSSDRRSLE